MNQRQGQGRNAAENQQITHQQRMQQALNQLLRDVDAKRKDIEAVLPADIPFEKFQACLNMAIRREPKLLECHGPSLIRAVLMSAYDGLMPDGREAVIVYRAMSYKNEDGSWAKGKRLEASYMPMAYGLRKKIVQAGAATHIKAVVVYSKEHFDYEEGLHPRLEHRPIIDGDRGDLIAVYSIATLPNGDREFEVMRNDDVMKVKAKAQTKDVWEGPFEGEMWRKSVLRRHSKALPTSTPIRDAEAQVMFPEFNRNAALPPPGAKPATPTRDQFAQLGAPEVELPLDLSAFGGSGEMEPEQAERREDDQPRQRRRAEPEKKGDGKGQGHDGAGVSEGARADEGGTAGAAEEGAGGGAEPAQARTEEAPPALARPQDEEGWEAWQGQVLTELRDCRRPGEVDRLQMREHDNTKVAPKKVRQTVENAFTDKRVDLQENRDDDA